MEKKNARVVGVIAGIAAALSLIGLLHLISSAGNSLMPGSGSTLTPAATWEWSTAAALAVLVYWAITGFAHALVRSAAFGRLFLGSWGAMAVLTPFAFGIGAAAETASAGSGTASQLVNDPTSATAVGGAGLIVACFGLGIFYGFFAGFPIAVLTCIVGAIAAAPGRDVGAGFGTVAPAYGGPVQPALHSAPSPFRTPVPGAVIPDTTAPMTAESPSPFDLPGQM